QGYYTINGLHSGDYCVKARAVGRVQEVYDNHFLSQDATPVHVTAPNNTPNINFTLELGGTITGTVRDEHGNPINNIHVYATDYSSNAWTAGINTGTDGTYSLVVPTGSYRVGTCAFKCSGLPYVDEFYNNRYAYNLADPVPATVGQVTPNINFTLEQGGNITGVVRDAQGNPIPNVNISVNDYQTNEGRGGAITGQDGSFTIGGLPAGSYRLRANAPSPYVSKYYISTFDYNAATAVPVTASNTTSIDITLERGGTIRGHVYKADGQTPIPGVWVTATDSASNAWITNAQTSPDGSYTLVLPSGTYLVQTSSGGCDSGAMYIGEYYNNTYNYHNATPIVVSGQGDHPGIDFSLAGATLSPRADIGGAVNDGIAWLAGKQNPDGSWGALYQLSTTGLAVLNLELFDVSGQPLSPGYLYHTQVQNGLDYIFAHAAVVDIGAQPAGNPDINSNGKGVYFAQDGQEVYNTSIAMMAIAASHSPNAVVNVPGSPVNGWTYGQVLRDAVDWMAWAQTDSGYGRGGWNYQPMNHQGDRSDQSNSGWATLGLAYAEARFGLVVPNFVRSELSLWIDTTQNDIDGGSIYCPDPAQPSTWSSNTLRTGNLLQQMAYVGDTPATPRVQAAIGYLLARWNENNSDPGWRGCPASYHSTYTTMKGLEALGLGSIGSIDWFADFAGVLLSQQTSEGGWPLSNWDRDQGILSTEWALLTLQRQIPGQKPDLTVTQMHEEWIDRDAGIYRVFFTIQNRGNAAAPASEVALHIDGYIWEQSIPALGIGNTYSGSFDPVTLNGADDRIVLYADAWSAIDELVETNNNVTDWWARNIDFGDAPDSYGTLRSSNGARHMIDGPYLGAVVPDAEADGQPTPSASGDDASGIDDEDVTSNPMVLVRGHTYAPVIEVGGGGGWFQAWIDLNHDGIFQHPGEQMQNQYLPAGANTVSGPVPADWPLGETFARYRISSQGGLTPYGPAPDGEVEDYKVRIQDEQPGWELYIPGTEQDGIQFVAPQDGIYRFTITGGAVEVCPPASQPNHPEWWGWRTWVLFYKNRQIEWGAEGWNGNPNPSNWDFSMGYCCQPTYQEAEQLGIGTFIELPLLAGDYLTLGFHDSRNCFGDNSGGVSILASLVDVISSCTISGTIHYAGPVTGSHNLHVYAILYPDESAYRELVIPFSGPGDYPYTLTYPVSTDFFSNLPVIVAAVLDGNDSGVQMPFNCNPAQPMGLYPRMVPITAGGQISGIDIDLSVSTGSVSGNISYGGSAGGDIRVALLMGNPFPIVWVASVSIGAPGSYTFPCVPPGTYHVFAWRDINGDGQWGNNEPQGYYGLAQTPFDGSVAVSAGQQVSGINFSIYDPTTISGTVTYSGTRITHPENYNIYLHAHRGFVDENAWGSISGPGDYTLDSVAAGTYEIDSFLDADGSGGWPPTVGDPVGGNQWIPTIVVIGQPINDVDIAIDDTAPGGVVYGYVELQGRSDHSGVTVTATGTSGEGQFTCTTFNSNGYGLYFVGLPVGTYNISYSYTGYTTFMVNGVSVSAVLGGPTGMVVLPLVTLSPVSSGVTIHTGAVNCAVLGGVTITGFQNGVEVGSIVTDPSGNFGPVTVAAGTYQLVACKSGFRDETWTVIITGQNPVTLDFTGEHGLVPNAPSMSYALGCVNQWLYPDQAGTCALSMSKALSVVNAWQYPAE
ncbi:MAG: carboxypeptidase regulatory-like domain-containing protein, partial [Dehalococcoidia bacterium]